MLALLYLFSKIKKLKVNPVNLLFFAGFTIAVLSPHSVFTPSFQLSFTAVLGLILFRDLFQKEIKPPFLNWLYTTSVMSVVALTYTAPFLLYHFGRFSLTSLVSTPPMVLLLFPYLFLSIINLLTAFSIGLTVDLMDGLGLVFLKVNRLFSQAGLVYAGYSPSKLQVALFLAFLIGIHLIRIKDYLKLTLSVAGLLLFLNLSATEPKLCIHSREGRYYPQLAVITPEGECFYTGKSFLPLLDREGCREKIPLHIAPYAETVNSISYRKEKGRYVIYLNGRQFVVENRTYTYCPEK